MSNKIIYIIVVLILILIILFLSFGKQITKVSYINITDKEAQTLISKGALVVDVRTENEYNQKHIKGAINIPYDKIDTIDADKDQEIILYCRSGSRAKTAAEELIKLGFTKVYNLGALDSYTGETE